MPNFAIAFVSCFIRLSPMVSLQLRLNSVASDAAVAAAAGPAGWAAVNWSAARLSSRQVRARTGQVCKSAKHWHPSSVHPVPRAATTITFGHSRPFLSR